LLLLVSVLGCGGAEGEAEYPAAPPREAQPQVVRDQRPAAGSVWRDELLQTLNAGLGSFLQHVEVEASLEEGRFRGFRITQLIPPAYWDGVDIAVGDVVVSVNDLPIERETEAYAAFESLRNAKAIRVKLLRAGNPQEITVAIVERNVPAQSATGGAGGTSSSVAGQTAASGAAAGGAAGASAVGNTTAGSTGVSPKRE
jgi:hypothetical protein